jgi:hypothetical protein
MDMAFWATLAGFCTLALAFELSVRLIKQNEKAPRAHDPYRMDRFRNGEPLDPDDLP